MSEKTYYVELATNQQARVQMSRPSRLSFCIQVRDILVNGYLGAGYVLTDRNCHRRLCGITLLSKGGETVAIQIIEDTRVQDIIAAQKVRWAARNAGHAETVSDYTVDVDQTPTEGLFVDELSDTIEIKGAGV